MKVAALIEYTEDETKIKATHPAHRAYLRTFLENGQLLAAGPFGANAGALWILEVNTVEEAEEIVKGDPFVLEDVIVDWKIRPLAYWSAKESMGK